MSRVVLEQEAFKLENLSGRIEVCNASGRRLGYFIPEVDKSVYDEIEIPVTEEELRRAEQETGGYTTAEVLEYLKILGRP